MRRQSTGVSLPTGSPSDKGDKIAAEDGAYDAFLSYSWQDRATVEPVAQVLRPRGINPFLDRWYPTPDLPRITALQGALDRCTDVVVREEPNELDDETVQSVIV